MRWEYARLDRAQAAIWSQVLAGNYRAVTVYLQISQRRAKLNGLDSPASLGISPNVRGEWSERCPTCSRYWAWSPMAEQTEDPFDLPLDDEWDLEPGDDGDIRAPETVLARMRASAGARSMRPTCARWSAPARGSRAPARCTTLLVGSPPAAAALDSRGEFALL